MGVVRVEGGGPWYDTIYVVARTWDPFIVDVGNLLFWDDHGRLYTIIIHDMATGATQPLATIVRVYRMNSREMVCLYGDPEASLCDCIPGIRERLEEVLSSLVSDAGERLERICGR